jgi:hypothetical protein
MTKESDRGGDEHNPGSPVVPLTPVVHGRAIPTLPRTLVFGVVVGVLAFVAGLQFNLGRTPEVAVVSPSPAGSASSVPIDEPTPAGGPPVLILPTSLALADTFDPGPVLKATPDGTACQTNPTTGSGVPSAGSGRLRVRTWLSLCPLRVGLQAAFRDLLFQEFANTVRASSGWSVTTDDAGLSTAELPFDDDGIPLTLVVAVRPVGDNLVIALTLAATAQ